MGTSRKWESRPCGNDGRPRTWEGKNTFILQQSQNNRAALVVCYLGRSGEGHARRFRFSAICVIHGTLVVILVSITADLARRGVLQLAVGRPTWGLFAVIRSILRIAAVTDKTVLEILRGDVLIEQKSGRGASRQIGAENASVGPHSVSSRLSDPRRSSSTGCGRFYHLILPGPGTGPMARNCIPVSIPRQKS